MAEHRTPFKILIYVPNLIGYLRLGLFITGAIYFKSPSVFLPCYAANVILDYFDGFFAKKLGQCSVFGAWLDVVVDNISRGFLWSKVHHFGYLVACTEWLVFVCTHTNQDRWKHVFGNAPRIVQMVMEDGLHSYYGWFAMFGSFWLPLWLYVTEFGLFQVNFATLILLVLLICGRALTFVVEGYIVVKHIEGLLEVDCKQK